MSSFLSLAPLAAAETTGARSALVAVAPAALVLAAVLVLLTVLCTVALVREIRRDGYGLSRPRPMSDEFPWQVTWTARGRRTARPWGTRRQAGTARR